MQCPYCGGEMSNGILFGDGRTKVRWQPFDKKIKISEKIFTEKGCIDARYSLARAKFEIDCAYCEKCNKIIISTKIKNN